MLIRIKPKFSIPKWFNLFSRLISEIPIANTIVFAIIENSYPRMKKRILVRKESSQMEICLKFVFLFFL